MRKPIRIGDHQGFAYRDLEPDLLLALPDWLASRSVVDGEDLKRGLVFRWRDLAVKFGGPSRRWRDGLRHSASIRAADLQLRLPEVAMPEPYVALERRGWHGLESHLLVSEFIVGEFLHDLFGRDARAVSAYAAFLADMHRRGSFHCDLHTLNTLWDGKRWVVIDADGFRNPLHGLRRSLRIANQWGLLASNLVGLRGATEKELRAFFDEYVALSQEPFNVERVWARAMEFSAKKRANWQ